MSTEPSPRAEQIQANVAAALSRLRGEPSAEAGQAPVAAPSTALAQRPQANGSAPEILTKAEPLLDVGNAATPPSQISSGQPAMGAPDPAMALNTSPGMHPGDTPFERMTGLKMTGVKLEDQPDLLQDMGVPPPPLADLPDVDEEAQRRRRRLRNRLMLGGFAVVLLVGFWILSGGDGANEEIPVITADGAPERVKPEDEGGLTVPNQDVAILNNDTEAATATAETVMPETEQPVTPPPPPEPAVVAPEVVEPVAAAPAVVDPTAPATETASAIPSVSAPEPTAIPSVAAPTELAPEAQPAAEAATTAEPAAAATEQPVAETATTETASASAVPSVKAAIQPVPGGTIHVQLASVKSEDGARQEWSRLQRAHPALLGGLELNIEKFEKSAGEIYYRVQAGPLGDSASAKLICSELKQKNQACIVAK